MATINLGQIGFPYMGNYNNTTPYKKGQIVRTDEITKTLVIALVDNQGIVPNATIISSTNTYSDGTWHLYYTPTQNDFRGNTNSVSIPVQSEGNRALVVNDQTTYLNNMKNKNLVSVSNSGYNHYNKFTAATLAKISVPTVGVLSQLNGAKAVQYEYNGDKLISQLPTGKSYRTRYALTKNNRIVVFGATDGYARGVGEWAWEERTRNFIKIPSVSMIKKLYSFYNGGAVLLENNELWVWGYNNYGHLGLGHGNNVPIPVLSATNVKEFYPHPTNAESTYHQSMYVAINGDVYGAGYNGNGHIGDGTTVSKTAWTKTLISGVDKLFGEAGGSTCTWYATKLTTGELWGWGYNNDGQLGTGNITQQNTPIKLNIPFGVSFVATSNGSNSVSTLAVSLDGTQIYSAGYNNYGQLGTGTTTASTTFIAATALNSKLSTGKVLGISIEDNTYASCVLWTNLGKVLTWGYNGYGQLSNGGTTTSAAVVNTIFDHNSINHPIKKAMMMGNGSYTSLVVWTKDRTTGVDTLQSCGYNGNLQLGTGLGAGNYTTLQTVVVPNLGPNQDGIRDIMVYGHSSESRIEIITESGDWLCTGNTYQWSNPQRANVPQKAQL